VYEVLPVEQADYILSKIGESLESGRVVTGEYSLQIEGQELWFAFNASPLTENTVILVAHDISERIKAQQQLVYYNEKLEEIVAERTRELQEAQEKLVRQEKLALLGQVAGNVGHELRNPLTIIKNSAYFLKLVQPDANEKIKEHLGMIESEIHTAEKIISELLDFARIKSVDPEPFSVSGLLQASLDRFPAPPAVTLALDLPPDLPRLYVDPEQMIRVLGNLALNAYQAMPAGGRLSISAHPEGEFVAIAVTDTGVGIPPENMPKLFEPLFTTKAKGIGLGLVVCRKLVEANRGRIEVQSQVGVGTTFSLFLPVKP
jgi:signal transduction histidine kinase